MTLYSSDKKGARCGKQHARNCKIIIVGRCWSTTTSCNVAPEWNTRKTEVFFCHRMNFIDELREIQISSQQRKEKNSPVTPQEQTELRGLLGGLGWKCEQTGPQHSAATGLQRSRIEQATVQDIGHTDLQFPYGGTINIDRMV